MIVIDEVYTFEVSHVLYFSHFCQRLLGAGDPKQILAFHTRASPSRFAITPKVAEHHIICNYSLGLPVDVLVLGKKLGFVHPDSLTCNNRRSLSLLPLTEETEVVPRTKDHLNITFSRNKLTEQFVTAHQSQGSRPKTVDVYIRNSEEHWCPNTAHFWVAISRATESTILFMEPLPLTNFEAHTRVVNGTDVVDMSLVESYRHTFTTGDIMQYQHNGSLTQAFERSSLSAYVPVFHTMPDYTDLRPAYTVTHVDPHLLANAITKINLNVHHTSYLDVTELSDLVFQRAATVPCYARLDLNSRVASSSSILPPAGVNFRSEDTVTEFYTIADRYLCNEQTSFPPADDLADQLLKSFFKAYVDPSKESFVPIDFENGFNGWLRTRKLTAFQLDGYQFAEAKHTTEFRSFLKSHAKAKNAEGFGLQVEKGQTIAAGHQSYNARMTSYARQYQNAMQQILYDEVTQDVGFSDSAFEQKAKRLGMYSGNDTQIDLSSQDSTHREHHVIAFINLLRLTTDITDEDCALYYQMRKLYRVTARNFSSDQKIAYETSWVLPSGDPFTLSANGAHEDMSIAYIFQLTREMYGTKEGKGDDIRLRNIVPYTSECERRTKEIGVKLKIDYGKPDFFAARFILPNNTVAFDPVKIAAKFSVKTFSPDLIDEYCQAYRDICKPLTPEERLYVIWAASVHHPSMTIDEVEVLYDFAHSLHDREYLLSYLKKDFSLRAQLVSEGSGCLRAALKAAKYAYSDVPKKHTWSAIRSIQHLRTHSIPYDYKPNASRTELDYLARSRPMTLMLSNCHASIVVLHSRIK